MSEPSFANSFAKASEFKKASEGKKIARIVVDRDLCIGAASCLALAPETFELDEEGKAVVKGDISKETYETLMAAAESCPTKAISVYDEDGNQLFVS